MWIKDGKLYRSSIVLDGRVIYNPTEDQLIAAGYEKVDPTPDTREWVDKELFIRAAYALVPAETIPAVLADPETAKSAITGMTLLTTAAAPGNLLDISDPRVAEWLQPSGVTVDQVREAMAWIMGGE